MGRGDVISLHENLLSLMFCCDELLVSQRSERGGLSLILLVYTYLSQACCVYSKDIDFYCYLGRDSAVSDRFKDDQHKHTLHIAWSSRRNVSLLLVAEVILEVALGLDFKDEE